MDKTICVFGDSVTQAAYIKVGWVDLLRQYLEEKYESNFVNVLNLGVGGHTSNDLLKRFKVEAQSRTPTSIIFAVGVNDSGHYSNSIQSVVTETQFKTNLKTLIKHAKQFSLDVIFIGLVLGDDSLLNSSDTTNDKLYETNKVVLYDNIIKEISKQQRAKFIPLFDKLEHADFLDGLHPNELGHKKMFEEIKKYF